jgi:hypothetical protein
MAHLLRGGGAPTIPYMRPKARRPEEPLYLMACVDPPRSLGARAVPTRWHRQHVLRGGSQSVFYPSFLFFTPLLFTPLAAMAHAFRGGDAPTKPYMRPKARRRDLLK